MNWLVFKNFKTGLIKVGAFWTRISTLDELQSGFFQYKLVMLITNSTVFPDKEAD